MCHSDFKCVHQFWSVFKLSSLLTWLVAQVSWTMFTEHTCLSNFLKKGLHSFMWKLFTGWRMGGDKEPASSCSNQGIQMSKQGVHCSDISCNSKSMLHIWEDEDVLTIKHFFSTKVRVWCEFCNKMCVHVVIFETKVHICCDIFAATSNFIFPSTADPQTITLHQLLPTQQTFLSKQNRSITIEKMLQELKENWGLETQEKS